MFHRPEPEMISVFLPLLSIDSICFLLTIAFGYYLMGYASMLSTPAHTNPNKSHFRGGLRAFSTRGNYHLLSRQNNRLCQGGLLSFHPQQLGELCWANPHPPSGT